ncbi:hypothetical protein [Rhodopirellula europaea]|uniref:Uncharacterized protein n=1 Tax=Rhodopirellula europaea 6C TaxID=1263867 RepID=M2A379_9BACT|nr:hypothetical protein [Rhodopirellula europaea]EMB13281.1 hypothetical protein RE6C_06001 [Rhodopirellula europaea 6C]
MSVVPNAGPVIQTPPCNAVHLEPDTDAHPDKIFAGRVLNSIHVSNMGQLVAGGMVPTDRTDEKPTHFAV